MKSAIPALVTATNRHFDLKEVSADKAYLAHANLAAIEAAGSDDFCAFLRCTP